MARPRSRPPFRRRLFVWLCTFAGGALNGMSVFLWAQLSGIRFAREQHDELNFMEKFLGKLTFLWRSLDEKIVLALGDVPDSYLVQCEYLANFLGAVGLVVLLLPVFMRYQRRGGGRVAGRTSARTSRR